MLRLESDMEGQKIKKPRRHDRPAVAIQQESLFAIQKDKIQVSSSYFEWRSMRPLQRGACLLDVFLQRPGKGEVHHPAYPRCIKAHAKCHSCSHDTDLAVAEACLDCLPLLSRTLRVTNITASGLENDLSRQLTSTLIFRHPGGGCSTRRYGSTAELPAKCTLEYHRIS